MRPRSLLPALLFALGSCSSSTAPCDPPPVTVRLSTGPSFELPACGNLTALSVRESASGQSMWAIIELSGTPLPARVVYGQVPSAGAVATPARPLQAGTEYTLSISRGSFDMIQAQFEQRFVHRP